MRRAAWLLAPALALAGFSPFKAEERNVREGNERLASGDAAAALSRYGDAERAVGERAEIEYDRGDAYYRLGRLAAARDAWRRALQRGDLQLSSRASQNVASALAADGDRAGAIAALVDALRADPNNEDARFNLEVLLRQEEAERRHPDSEPAQSRLGRAGRQDTSPQGRPGSNPSSREPSSGDLAGRLPEPSSGNASAVPGADEVNSEAAEASSLGADAPLAREEAERILDAFRSRERPLPRGGEAFHRRAEVDRDW